MQENKTFKLSNIEEIYPDEKIIQTKDGRKHKATREIINGKLWPQHHPNLLTDETSYLTWLRSFLHTDKMLEQSAKHQRLNAARSGIGLLRTQEEKNTITYETYRGNIEAFDQMASQVRPQILADVEKHKQDLITQHKADEENLRVMNDPKRKLVRNWPHRNIDANRQEIATIEKETVEVLEGIREHVLASRSQDLWQTFAKDLAEENKTSLLAWLNAIIDMKKNKQNQQPETLGKKFAKFVHLP